MADQRIYLDHNATTPLDPAVFEAMRPYLIDLHGNASSIEHIDGQIAQRAVERAREQVAAAIGARPNEIVFTGSCTEANNIAILGAARAAQEPQHIVTSTIEHHAVLGPIAALERDGWSVTRVAPDGEGLIDPTAVAAAISGHWVAMLWVVANTWPSRNT